MKKPLFDEMTSKYPASSIYVKFDKNNTELPACFDNCMSSLGGKIINPSIKTETIRTKIAGTILFALRE